MGIASTLRYVAALQLLVMLMMQANLLAPKLAAAFTLRNVPVVEEADCQCTADCGCPPEMRRNGTCCCQRAAAGANRTGTDESRAKDGLPSLRCCPCHSLPQFSLFSLEQLLVPSFFVLPEVPLRLARAVFAAEPVSPSDRTLDPPDPPPRLIPFLRSTSQVLR